MIFIRHISTETLHIYIKIKILILCRTSEILNPNPSSENLNISQANRSHFRSSNILKPKQNDCQLGDNILNFCFLKSNLTQTSQKFVSDDEFYYTSQGHNELTHSTHKFPNKYDVF